jgi:hypothetical protein
VPFCAVSQALRAFYLCDSPQQVPFCAVSQALRASKKQSVLGRFCGVVFKLGFRVDTDFPVNAVIEFAVFGVNVFLQMTAFRFDAQSVQGGD